MNVLDSDTRSLEYCTYCPKLCRHVCPVSNAEPREAIIPQQKMQTANLLRRGHVPWKTDYTQVLYACSGCGACTEACAHRVEPGRVLMQARLGAQLAGAVHPALSDLVARFTRRNERLALSLRERTAPAMRRDKAEIAFHPACETIASYPEDLDAALALLGRLVPQTPLATTEVPCAGYPLWAGGFHEAFVDNARRFAQAASGHASVVSSCPACVYVMRTVYPTEKVKLPFVVVHLQEFLEQKLHTWQPKLSRERALYHDPCFLGRQSQVYEAPRALLSRVADVAEFSRTRQEAECSGGGGLVPKTMPEVARAMATRRLGEARTRGIKRIVTACSTCKRQFLGAGKGLQIEDLTTLLANQLAKE